MPHVTSSRTAFINVALAACACLVAAPAGARTWFVAEMNSGQLAALDHSKTVVMLPGGILEEHGPYLPSYTDGYVSERQARDVADALVEKGWDVLIFPPLPLGAGGANELGGKFPFPGTYAIRLKTLRALYMDLADELGESGFKWVFVVNSHGAPNHNRILDQACDYFTATYHGRMVHITGGSAPFSSAEDPRNTLSEAARREDAYSGHAGIDETSLLLFLRPDLVNSDYRMAPSFAATGDHGMIDIATNRKDWTGYFGAPRYSSAEYGARLYRLTTARMVQQALSTLDSPSAPAQTRRRPLRPADDVAIARDSAIEKRQQDWIERDEQPPPAGK
jgi:creatinine amidohydrolase/Fe(II)-dependent formamide hydrolase-like protein